MSLSRVKAALVNEIKATRQFKELKQAQSNLNKNKKVKEQLEALQRRQMELFKSKRPARDMERQAKQIENEFQILSRYPEVSRMTKATDSFNKVMGSIYKDISSMLDMELKS